MPKVRVRFAPSPTGHVHVGNARTALFNWLFARHHGGVFALRIEDTDVERSKEEYERQLLADLRWFGLDWDEGPDKGGPFGPYRQSERRALYTECSAKLIAQGDAYYCFCSAEQLEAERQEELKAGRQPRYSGRCRKLDAGEAARRKAAGEPAAVRLKILESSFFWNDLVHGPTTFSSEVIGDPVLVRSEGSPAYNYAVVIDDHLMEISHVIRGDDHISNTPRQLALYRALGWEPPAFAHLSTILGSDRTRLSKRHGATSMESFREMGILPEALRNYLALLGWSPADGKTEILSPSELVAQFSLEHITKSPAVFDTDKLHWLNRHYMKECPPARLVALAVPYLEKVGYLAGHPGADVLAWVESVLAAVVKNINSLSQLPEAVRVIFEFDVERARATPEFQELLADPGARAVLKAFIPKVLIENPLTYERFREIAKSVQKETGKKGKDLFHPIRVAVTGAASGPELEKLVPIYEAGSKLPLAHHVKSVAERLREFAEAAGF
ncbi:MAG: glutamate--tRNA ligase [Terriglobia bacterium]|jgi:glutamyl-tRNA synthetase/nondiscriminating glutamyl-tRNA synthetase